MASPLIMRLLSSLAVVLLLPQTSTGQTCAWVHLETQADVDAFNCTTISGSLIIGPGTGIADAEISSLDGLLGLTSIGEDLQIRYNEALVSFKGLDSLKSVGNQFVVSNNAALVSLQGLEAVTYVRHLLVWDNPSLSSVDGLSKLSTVGGRFEFTRNSALLDLDGLASLQSTGNLVLGGNDNLGSISSLSEVRTLSYIYIHSNDKLSNLVGLDNLETSGDLWIDNNDGLTDLSSLRSLSEVHGALKITFNAVVDLSGLESLRQVDGLLQILGNDHLVDIDGLRNLTYVGGGVQVWGNTILSNVDGLSSLTHVGSDLVVNGNPMLRDCSCGLYALVNSGGIGGRIQLTANAAGCNGVSELVPTPSCSLGTSVSDGSDLPPGDEIGLPFPNPFSKSVNIPLNIAAAGPVELSVWDSLGRRVTTLYSGWLGPGRNGFTLDASVVAPGVYVIRLETAGRLTSRRVTCVK